MRGLTAGGALPLLLAALDRGEVLPALALGSAMALSVAARRRSAGLSPLRALASSERRAAGLFLLTPPPTASGVVESSGLERVLVRTACGGLTEGEVELELCRRPDGLHMLWGLHTHKMLQIVIVNVQQKQNLNRDCANLATDTDLDRAKCTEILETNWQSEPKWAEADGIVEQR